MNTLHLTYAVEVERCGSITQAAENLYMAQPNLSKAIRELEDAMGFAIFERTPRGMAPTVRGREFLAYAREILAQLQKMESLSLRRDDARQRFSLSMPCAGYLAECVSQLIAGLDKERSPDIRVREASAVPAVHDVANGQFQLGVIRYDSAQEADFAGYLREKGLAAQLLWEFDALLLFSRRHPLAAREAIACGDLTAYTEMLPGDGAPPHRPPAYPQDAAGGRIRVEDRLSQLELLSRANGVYMWTSPESADTLKRFSLVQRACADGGPRFRDVLIYPAAYRFSQLDRRFIGLAETAVKALEGRADK